MQRKLEEDSHSRGTIDKSCPSMIDCGWLGIGKRPDFLLTKWCLAIAIKQASNQATKQPSNGPQIARSCSTLQQMIELRANFSRPIKRNAQVELVRAIRGKRSPFMSDFYCRLSAQTRQRKPPWWCDRCTQGLITAF